MIQAWKIVLGLRVGAIHELPLPSGRKDTLVVPGHAKRSIRHQEADLTSRSLQQENNRRGRLVVPVKAKWMTKGWTPW